MLLSIWDTQYIPSSQLITALKATTFFVFYIKLLMTVLQNNSLLSYCYLNYAQQF